MSAGRQKRDGQTTSLRGTTLSARGRTFRSSRKKAKQKGERQSPFPLNAWSGKRVSNSRPQPWQGCALPTELFPHFPGGASRSRTDLHGFAIRCITALLSRQKRTVRSSRKRHRDDRQIRMKAKWPIKQKGKRCFPIVWSGRRVSNSRPQPWQGCALPTELLPHICFRLRRIFY